MTTTTTPSLRLTPLDDDTPGCHGRLARPCDEPQSPDPATARPTAPSLPDQPNPDTHGQGLRTEDATAHVSIVTNSRAQPDPAASLPPLSPADSTLIDAFIEADADLRTLSTNTGTPLRDLLPWSRLPAIAPWIAALTLEQSKHVRSTTIAYLRTITAAPSTPVEGRRAASSILRCLYTPLPGSPEDDHPREPRRSPGATGRSQLRASDQSPASSAVHSNPNHDLQDSGPGTQDRITPTPPNPPPPPPPPPDPFAPTTPGDGLIPIAPTDFLPHPDHPIEHVAAHVLASIVNPDAPTPDLAAINLHNFSRHDYRHRDAAAPARTLARFQQSTPLAFSPADCTPGPIQSDLHPEWRSQECSIHTRATPDAPSRHLTLRLDFCRYHNLSWMLATITTREPGIPFDAYLPPHTTWAWYNARRR